MRLGILKKSMLFVLLPAMALACLWPMLGSTKQAPPLPPSTVAIIRAEQASVYDLTDREIREMVRRAVVLAGGLAAVIHRGDTVVVKPNLVEIEDYVGERHPLPEILSGVATDRRVVAAVAELAHEAGAGMIYVMEGSAVSTLEAFNHYGYNEGNIPYVDAFVAIEADSGGWLDYDSPRLAKVELPDGKYQDSYYLNRRYYEADVIISVPTLKNHWDAAVTGAVKNLSIGATPANIYGSSPESPLRWPRIPHGNEQYHCFMRDFYKCKPARFAVMDGLVGIQHGPTPHSERGSKGYKQDCMNMRLILAGRDAVALDTIEALVMGWDPAGVKYLQLLGADGLGNADPANIMVIGGKVSDVRRDFAGQSPSGGGWIYADHEPPKVELKSAKAAKDGYVVSLKTSKDVVRVEIYIDGVLAGSFRSGFERMEVSLAGFSAGEHRMRVAAYDRYMNGAELEVQVRL